MSKFGTAVTAEQYATWVLTQVHPICADGDIVISPGRCIPPPYIIPPVSFIPEVPVGPPPFVPPVEPPSVGIPAPGVLALMLVGLALVVRFKNKWRSTVPEQ